MNITLDCYCDWCMNKINLGSPIYTVDRNGSVDNSKKKVACSISCLKLLVSVGDFFGPKIDEYGWAHKTSYVYDKSEA